jgi:hypothetical protein
MSTKELMKKAAKKWRKMGKKEKAKYEGGFKDFAKVYIESHYAGRRKRK